METLNPLEIVDENIKQNKEKIIELEKEITHLENRRTYLLSLSEVCPSCNGSGEETCLDEPDGTNTKISINSKCCTCKGLGKISELKCRACGYIIGTDLIAIRRKYFPECPRCGGGLE